MSKESEILAKVAMDAYDEWAGLFKRNPDVSKLCGCAEHVATAIDKHMVMHPVLVRGSKDMGAVIMYRITEEAKGKDE